MNLRAQLFPIRLGLYDFFWNQSFNLCDFRSQLDQPLVFLHVLNWTFVTVTNLWTLLLKICDFLWMVYAKVTAFGWLTASLWTNIYYASLVNLLRLFVNFICGDIARCLTAVSLTISRRVFIIGVIYKGLIIFEVTFLDVLEIIWWNRFFSLHYLWLLWFSFLLSDSLRYVLMSGSVQKLTIGVSVCILILWTIS